MQKLGQVGAWTRSRAHF